MLPYQFTALFPVSFLALGYLLERGTGILTKDRDMHSSVKFNKLALNVKKLKKMFLKNKEGYRYTSIYPAFYTSSRVKFISQNAVLVNVALEYTPLHIRVCTFTAYPLS